MKCYTHFELAEVATADSCKCFCCCRCFCLYLDNEKNNPRMLFRFPSQTSLALTPSIATPSELSRDRQDTTFSSCKKKYTHTQRSNTALALALQHHHTAKRAKESLLALKQMKPARASQHQLCNNETHLTPASQVVENYARPPPTRFL